MTPQLILEMIALATPICSLQLRMPWLLPGTTSPEQAGLSDGPPNPTCSHSLSVCERLEKTKPGPDFNLSVSSTTIMLFLLLLGEGLFCVDLPGLVLGEERLVEALSGVLHTGQLEMMMTQN